VTVKNQSNRTIEIEINPNEAIVFAPHETKKIDAQYSKLLQKPLFVLGG